MKVAELQGEVERLRAENQSLKTSLSVSGGAEASSGVPDLLPEVARLNGLNQELQLRLRQPPPVAVTGASLESDSRLNQLQISLDRQRELAERYKAQLDEALSQARSESNPTPPSTLTPVTPSPQVPSHLSLLACRLAEYSPGLPYLISHVLTESR